MQDWLSSTALVSCLRDCSPDLAFLLALAPDDPNLDPTWQELARHRILVHLVRTELEARVALTHVDYNAAFLDLAGLPFNGRFFLEWMALQGGCSRIVCIGQPSTFDGCIASGLILETVAEPFAQGSLVRPMLTLLART